MAAAMQSVYQHSIGRQFVSETAPAVLLPGLDVMGLEEALRILSTDASRMRLAIWTIARSIPPAPLSFAPGGRTGLERYPDVLVHMLTPDQCRQLLAFEQTRSRWCPQAVLLSDAIVAFAAREECWEHFEAILKQFEDEREPGYDDLNAALMSVFGIPANGPERFSVADFLMNTLGYPRPCEDALLAFEREVQMRLPDFMRQFVDSIAFSNAFGIPGELEVLPAASITVQDSDTLITSVTVTTLVCEQDFPHLRLAMDPQSWSQGSDAFRSTRYVAGPLDLTVLDPPPTPGDPGPAPRYLEEDVVLIWGREGDAGGSCRNVLRLDRLDFDDDRIDIAFALGRSVESRLLWDVRAGGLLLDEGYSVARAIWGERRRVWRVTANKTMLWSDRLPSATGAGRQFGQGLNYLAPAVVSWWLESQLAGERSGAGAATRGEP